MATLPDQFTRDVSRWLRSRPQIEGTTLSGCRSLAFAAFCTDTGRDPKDVQPRRFATAVTACGWSFCQLRPGLGKLFAGTPSAEPFRLREKPKRERAPQTKRSKFKVALLDKALGVASDYKPDRRPYRKGFQWSATRRKEHGLDRLDALVVQALDKLGVQAIGADGYVQTKCEVARGTKPALVRRDAIKRVLSTGLLRRDDFPTRRKGEWLQRVGASLVRVTGEKEPRPIGGAFVWYRIDPSHSWHYCKHRFKRFAKLVPLAADIAIRDGVMQPYRPRPRNVERNKVMNAKRGLSALEAEALAPDANGELPDSLDGFFAVQAAAEQVAASGAKMTRKALREAAKAERDRLKAEKEAERHRIERERFQARAEANGRKALDAERRRVANAEYPRADPDAFSIDF